MSNPLQKHTTNFGKIRQTSQQKYNYINNLRQWRVIVLALSAFIFNTPNLFRLPYCRISAKVLPCLWKMSA